MTAPVPIRPSDPAPQEDGVKWLCLLLAEVFRAFLALAAKRYPEARGRFECPHCGWRQ
jgi:hypothetical protein